MRKLGLTLVETLLVISIIVMLAAFAYPVLVPAVRSAKAVSSTGRLRQQFWAIKLYQEDYGGEEGYGSVHEMNLPDARVFGFKDRYLGIPKETWISPCGTHPRIPAVLGYTYNLDDTDETTTRLLTFKDNFVLTSDLNCNSPEVDVLSKFDRKLGLGVSYGGQLIRRLARGDALKNEWWLPAAP